MVGEGNDKNGYVTSFYSKYFPGALLLHSYIIHIISYLPTPFDVYLSLYLVVQSSK